jgi:toxin ParE1/3/4
MKWCIIRSNAAKADLIDIWVYIATENPAAADKQIDRIDAVVTKLLDFPRLGSARHDIGPELRGLVVNRYLVLYRVRDDDKVIELLRVVDGRRDLAALFTAGVP